MVKKEYINPLALQYDSFSLAKKIYDSEFIPDYIIVLWRGGTPIGIIVHEFFHYKGIKTFHTAIKVESYEGIGKASCVFVENLDRLLHHINEKSSILVVDDIFDSGRTLEKVKNIMLQKTNNVKIAALYYKPECNKTEIKPDFYIKTTDKWVVFPHEIVDLTNDEIKEKDEQIWKLLE